VSSCRRQSEKSPPGRWKTRPPPPQGERILVGDDEPAIRDTVRSILASADYRVEIAGDEEAARLLARPGQRFDLAIVDANMPMTLNRTPRYSAGTRRGRESGTARGERRTTAAPGLLSGTMKTSHLDLRTESSPSGVLLEAHAHGTLDGNDYDVLLPELDAVLARGAPVNFILFLDDFHGWDIESMARELKWDAENRDRLRKVAVIGDSAWEKAAVTLSKIFLPGDVRYFARDAEPDAWAWVRASD
jgi:CheY-like chemotaxis protein